jgi:hypothetical protein
MRFRFPFSRVACDTSRAILILLMVAPALHAAQPRLSYNDRYGVIEDRNVFVKDRTHIVRGGSTRPSGDGGAPKRTIDESFVLTGVVAEDGGYRAYVENIDTSNVTRVAVGDSLHKGKVGAIETDAIAYDPAGGQRIWVEVGSDLTGKPSAALSARAAEEASSSGPAIASDIANINPNDPNLTIEQKMKLRRAQQMGQPLGGPAPAAAGASGAPAAAGATTQPQQQQPPPQQQPQQQPPPQPPQPAPIIVVPPEAFQQSGQP